MTEFVKFPKLPDAEDLTRQAVLDLLVAIDKPLYLKCSIERIEVRPTKIGPLLIVSLTLKVCPPKGIPELVPFRVSIRRTISPFKANSFWFEDVLGGVCIPWGEEVTQEQANAVFAGWVKKTAVAEFQLVEFEGRKVMRLVDLKKEVK